MLTNKNSVSSMYILYWHLHVLEMMIYPRAGCYVTEDFNVFILNCCKMRHRIKLIDKEKSVTVIQPSGLQHREFWPWFQQSVLIIELSSLQALGYQGQNLSTLTIHVSANSNPHHKKKTLLKRRKRLLRIPVHAYALPLLNSVTIIAN